ncbi:MAG: hypothetical protein HYS87_02360 [Candidatus Colwellbacteria bacterium]|nr:hypothetical protein [Candidatus Colwellbacteria bacterium]
MNKVGIQKKWSKFKHRVGLFNHVPFVDFAFAAGSMAMGSAREDSDFDVIVGARHGRIFTVRFFSHLFFALRKWRATHNSDSHLGVMINHNTRSKTADKICLNHFVTPKSYKFSPPYNEYWNKLYSNLVPLLGNEPEIEKFIDMNDWVRPERKYMRSPFHENFKPSRIRKFLERALSGPFGDYIEIKLKAFQIKRIKKSASDPSHYKPRIIYSDDELEFHPDTKRIEEILTKK